VVGLVLRRAAQALGVVFAAATLTFALLQLAPGDPLSQALDQPGVSGAVRERLRASYGFDRPVPEQYARYLAHVARGDLGHSFSHRRPVADALLDALPNTLLLMGATLALSFGAGIALGVYQALRRGSAGDRVLGAVSLAFYSLPDFWLALMAVLVFAYWVPVFPAGGSVDPVMHDYLGFWGRVADRLEHLALPALTLTLLTAAGVARYQRAALLDVAGDDWVRTARAKGVPPRAIVRRHLLRNAVAPTVTLLGLSLPALVGGAAVVEKVFSWPGLGLLAVNAIATRDYPLVTGAVIVASAAVAVGSLAADALHALVDPRVRSRG
jgi:peptide/nickel transport system permease protein